MTLSASKWEALHRATPSDTWVLSGLKGTATRSWGLSRKLVSGQFFTE